jgi:glycosyltransferase involved in cell wall biosynthesis
MARRYLEARIGHPEMYTRIFSGFKMEPFLEATNDPALRHKLGLAADSFVIGKIARMAPLKGHDDLLTATQDLLKSEPRARLLFVGDGPLRAEIEHKARSLGLADKVVMTGLVPPSDVAKYTGVMDCLAHLSYREAVSRALPQALAAGKPVVAYDFDGADEVCLPGQTGFLARTGDVRAVANHLLALAKDPQQRKTLGLNGRQLVEKEFKVENMITKIYALYKRLAGAKGIRN